MTAVVRVESAAVEAILGLVGEQFGVTRMWLTSGRARAARRISRARAAAMMLMHDRLGLTQKQIGFWLKLDHTSVGYALKNIALYRKNEPLFNERVGALREQFGLPA